MEEVFKQLPKSKYYYICKLCICNHGIKNDFIIQTNIKKRLRIPTLAPPAAGPARGPWAAGGPEELRDSDWLHGLCRDEVTVCFHYLYRRSRLVISQRSFLKKLVRFRIRRCESITAV